MLGEFDRIILLKLIVFRSLDGSLQEFFSYILEVDPELKVVRKLMQEIHAEDASSLDWLRNSCFVKRVEEDTFVQEISEFFTSYTSIPAQKRKRYELLQLSPWASKDEVKRQYRKLAQRYHPDTNAQQGEEGLNQFIELTQAYHSLMEEEECELVFKLQAAPPPAGHNEKAHAAIQKARRRNFAWSLAALAFLFLVAFVSERIYKNTIMMRQLTGHSTRPAHISKSVPAGNPDNSSTPTKQSIPEKGKAREREKIQISAAGIKNGITAPAQDLQVKNNQISKNDTQKLTKQHNEVCTEPREMAGLAKKKEISIPLMAAQTMPVSAPDEYPQKGAILLSPASPPATGKSPEAAVPVSATGKPFTSPGKTILKDKRLAQQETTRQTVIIKQQEQLDSDTDNAQTITKRASDAQNYDLLIEKQKVRFFLTRYVATYNKRNLAAFIRFFSEDAKENGKEITERLDAYKRLFMESDKIVLDYVSDGMQVYAGDMQVNGRFTLHIEYVNGNEFNGMGIMQFKISLNDNSYLIKNLQYTFFKP